MLDNAEDVMHSLEEFSKLKPKVIPRELEDYLGYVAKTGDPVFKWSMVKYLFREKMLSVINDFYEDTLTIELPPCPNVDAFNYDRMKTSLLERLESFHGAPFTIQRICELLTNPRKEYNRADKFMRAIEKNILVVSTREPGRFSDLDCESTQECSINGIREVGDSLDSTFIINDLGPGTDSSSPSTEPNDSLPDTNHLNTVERVSPVHDQDVSSDSDDSSLENGHVSIDGAPNQTNGVDSDQHRTVIEEADGANVSSTDMSLEEPSEVRCELLGNSVTSTHETVISNHQMNFKADVHIGEEMTDTSTDTAESNVLPEPCTDKSQADSVQEADKPGVSLEFSKSEVQSTPIAPDSDSTPESVSVSDIVAAECDTSHVEEESKSDNCVMKSTSVKDEDEISCDTNEQAANCDSTGGSGALNSECVEPNQIQPVNTLSDHFQSEVAHSECMAQPDTVESGEDQSNIIDQPEAVQTEVSSDIAQSSEISDSTEESNVSNQLNVVVQNESESFAADQSNSATLPDAVQPGSSSDEIMVPLAEDSVQSVNELDERIPLETAQIDIKQPQSDSQVGASDEALAPEQSNIIFTNHSLPINLDMQTVAEHEPDQVCDDASASRSVTLSEPMTESNDNDRLESLQTENDVETEQESRPEQEVQMDIPSDSEATTEPVQCNQPDSASSEPMDIDE